MTWLVLLYPPAWRDRYGDEMTALLSAERLGISDVWDVLCCALDTWITGPRGAIFGERASIRAVGSFAIVALIYVVRQAPTATTPESRVAMMAGALFVVMTTRLALRAVHSAECAGEL